MGIEDRVDYMDILTPRKLLHSAVRISIGKLFIIETFIMLPTEREKKDLAKILLT